MSDTEIPAPDATQPEQTAPERLTAPKAPTKTKAAPKPKAAPKATEQVATEEQAGQDYRVHCPTDHTLPPRIVRGLTAADARETYCRDMGILVAGHPLVALPVGGEPDDEE